MAQRAPEVLAAAKAAPLYGKDAAMAAMKNERELLGGAAREEAVIGGVAPVLGSLPPRRRPPETGWCPR